jgi:hypothetical protein
VLTSLYLLVVYQVNPVSATNVRVARECALSQNRGTWRCVRRHGTRYGYAQSLCRSLHQIPSISYTSIHEIAQLMISTEIYHLRTAGR